jgi:arginase
MSPSRISVSAEQSVLSEKLPDSPASSNGSRTFGMNTSMIESKFLTHPEELGVVAVGFSGGQVRKGLPLPFCLVLEEAR